MHLLFVSREALDYYGWVVKTGGLCFIDRDGGGVGAVGFFERSHQVLVVVVLSQFRGVARRRRLGMVDAGPKIGEEDLGHLCLKLRGHVRPEVRKRLHVGRGGVRSGGWRGWSGVPGSVPVRSPKPPRPIMITNTYKATTRA